jgi:hypothetical protein
MFSRVSEQLTSMIELARQVSAGNGNHAPLNETRTNEAVGRGQGPAKFSCPVLCQDLEEEARFANHIINNKTDNSSWQPVSGQ